MTNEAEYRAKIMKGRFIYFLGLVGNILYIYVYICKKTTQNKTKHIEKQILNVLKYLQYH